MDQTKIEIVKLVIMAAACLIAYTVRKDVLPFIRQKMTADQLRQAQEMASMFVYMAQQCFGDKSGQERKKIVTEALSNALEQSGIYLTDEFINDMIEAAVKGLRIAESGNQTENN